MSIENMMPPLRNSGEAFARLTYNQTLALNQGKSLFDYRRSDSDLRHRPAAVKLFKVQNVSTAVDVASWEQIAVKDTLHGRGVQGAARRHAGKGRSGRPFSPNLICQLSDDQADAPDQADGA
jgi:hypothetical protein